MKRHRSLEEKLAVIKLVEQGQSARSVSDITQGAFYVAHQFFVINHFCVHNR